MLGMLLLAIWLIVPMRPEVVAAEVLQPGGSVATVEHTFWQTQSAPCWRFRLPRGRSPPRTR